ALRVPIAFPRVVDVDVHVARVLHAVRRDRIRHAAHCRVVHAVAELVPAIPAHRRRLRQSVVGNLVQRRNRILLRIKALAFRHTMRHHLARRAAAARRGDVQLVAHDLAFVLQGAHVAVVRVRRRKREAIRSAGHLGDDVMRRRRVNLAFIRRTVGLDIEIRAGESAVVSWGRNQPVAAQIGRERERSEKKNSDDFHVDSLDVYACSVTVATLNAGSVTRSLPFSSAASSGFTPIRSGWSKLLNAFQSASCTICPRAVLYPPPCMVHSTCISVSCRGFTSDTTNCPPAFDAEIESSGTSGGCGPRPPRPACGNSMPSASTRTLVFPRCGLNSMHDQYVEVRTVFLPSGPSVSSTLCSTFTICAMLHMYSLSACRLKMFSPSPAATALRILDCCHSLPFWRSSDGGI